MKTPLYSERFLAQVKTAIFAGPGVPPAHRAAILDVVNMVRRYEYGSFTEYNPNFLVDAPFGKPVLATEPQTRHPNGPQNVVAQIDGQRRIRLW